jgi:hypothetical protein
MEDTVDIRANGLLEKMQLDKVSRLHKILLVTQTINYVAATIEGTSTDLKHLSKQRVIAERLAVNYDALDDYISRLTAIMEDMVEFADGGHMLLDRDTAVLEAGLDVLRGNDMLEDEL